MTLEERVAQLERENAALHEEVASRIRWGEAMNALHKSETECLLRDIGSQLDSEFQDFFESVNTPMSELLGEIYRDKLANIYRQLTKSGVIINL